MLTMDWKDLQYRKPKPISKKVKKTKSSQVVHVKYSLVKSDFSASSWRDYKEWLKEQRLKEELQKKALERSKKKKPKSCPQRKKKLNSGSGNSLKSKRMSYEEQLKDKRWLKKRKEVLDKKGYICSNCGSKFGLEIHHLKYKKDKMAWEYPMSNFVVLCRKCHKKMHGLA